MKRHDPFIPLAERVRWVSEVRLEPAREVTEDVGPGLLSAVESALLGGETHYTVRPGIPELRRSIAQQIVRAGGPLPNGDDPAENVLITSGESEALFVVLLSLGWASGNVLVSARPPCRHGPLFRLMGFHVATEAALPAQLHLTYREWDSDEERQKYVLARGADRNLCDVLDLKQALWPSGTFPPFDAGRTLLVGNLDAVAGLSSFRVGYLVGPKARIARIRPWKQALSICSAAPSQRAALYALAQGRTS